MIQPAFSLNRFRTRKQPGEDSQMIRTVNQALFETIESFPVFALILFTEVHPEVIRALRDELYYSALDEISGTDVLVFATLLLRATRTYPQPPPGIVPTMRPIWLEPKANEEIMSWFGIKNRDQLPAFVVFGFSGHNMYYQLYDIPTVSAGAVFDFLSERLREIRKVLKTTGSELNMRVFFRRLGWRQSLRRAATGAQGIVRAIGYLRDIAGT